MNKKTGLRRKIISIICILVAIMSAVLIVISYKAFSNAYINFYYEKALGVVKMLANEVDGDRIDQYLKTGETDEAYMELQKHFNNAKENVAGLNYLYLMKPYEDHFVYILEAYTKEDNMDNIAELGEVFTYGRTEYEYLVPDVKAKSASTQIVYGEDNGLGRSISVWAPVMDQNGEVAAVVEADYVLMDIRETINRYVMNVFLFLLLAQVIITIIMVNVIDRKVVNPILTLTKYVNSYKKGNIVQEPIQIQEENEIKWLADSFNDMIDKIKAYVEDIERVTAEKERIGAELNIATQIQADMLPCIFPPFPGRTEIDLYASMTPAKEVGGDFYDFFLINKDHLALVIADVSGKGVPAALFMVIAKTLIKNRLMLGASPKETLEAVNNQLCENNEAEMFVTVWLGVYEISTGILTAANAGHEYPVLKRSGEAFELFKDKHGFVLAGMENMKYKEYTIELREGDTLFVYTDGVPEATNHNKELFGADRMLETLNQYDEENLENLLHHMKQELDSFSAEAPQFDDITMLAFHVNEIGRGGNQGMKEWKIEASLDKLDEVQELIRTELEGYRVSQRTLGQIDICVEEIFVNIANYAYGSKQGEVVIGCEVEQSDPASLRISFSDGGTPFNPLAKEEADITLSAEERKIGGLGIFMVRKMMDNLEYSYEDGKNILTMWKALS